MTRASDTAKLLGAGATILDGTTITTADNTTQVTLKSTDADGNSGPELDYYRLSASPADNDYLGRTKYIGRNDNTQDVTAVDILARMIDVSDGEEDATYNIRVMKAGSLVDRVTLNGGETILNEDSVDLNFRVESNGNANMLFVDGGDDAVVIGHNASRKTLFNTTATAALQIEGTSGNTAAMSIARNSNDDNGPQLVLAKSNGTAGAAVTVVTDDALLGRISFQGADGTQTVEAARVEGFVDGTPGANDMPGRLVFSTTADGAATPTESMRITAGGSVGIGLTTPVANLEIKKTVSTTGSMTDTALHLTTDATTGRKLNIGFGLGGGVANTNVAVIGFDVTSGSGATKGDLFFSTRTGTSDAVPTERMRIKSEGKIGILTPTCFGDGVTITPSTADSTLSTCLVLSSGANSTINSGARMVLTGCTNDPLSRAVVLEGKHEGNDNALSFRIFTSSNNTPVEHFRVHSDGVLTATDTSIGSNSDSRLKKDIQDYTYDIDKFKLYTPKTFEWINKEVHGNRENNRGFLAQDIKDIDDRWVGKTDVQEDTADYDIISDNISLTSKLGEKDAMYISIIQQLITKIETLETKVTALEGA